MTNYVIFTERTLTVGGVEFQVQAGHAFAVERAATFKSAWCYVNGIAEGLLVRLNLGGLPPGGAPMATPDPFTRTALRLNADQETELFRACPWKEFPAGGTAGG